MPAALSRRDIEALNETADLVCVLSPANQCNRYHTIEDSPRTHLGERFDFMREVVKAPGQEAKDTLMQQVPLGAHRLILLPGGGIGHIAEAWCNEEGAILEAYPNAISTMFIGSTWDRLVQPFYGPMGLRIRVLDRSVTPAEDAHFEALHHKTFEYLRERCPGFWPYEVTESGWNFE